MMNSENIDLIKQHGKRAKGKKELIKYLEGGKLTYKQAVQAKCFECMGYCIDGRIDCGISDCPLYPFMPHNNHGMRK